MNFMGKAFTIMLGVGLAGIGALTARWILSWQQDTTYALGWVFLTMPFAAMLVLSGGYLVYRGVTAPPVYVSPTGTGETGPSK